MIAFFAGMVLGGAAACVFMLILFYLAVHYKDADDYYNEHYNDNE